MFFELFYNKTGCCLSMQSKIKNIGREQRSLKKFGSKPSNRRCHFLQKEVSGSNNCNLQVFTLQFKPTIIKNARLNKTV